MAVIPVIYSTYPLFLFFTCMVGKFAGRLIVGYYKLYMKGK